MSDPRTYRISDDAMANTDLLAMVEHEDGDYLLGRLVPDDTLQQIADAWSDDVQGLRRVMDWPELTGLLNGLVNE